jgi:hypothetical protein
MNTNLQYKKNTGTLYLMCLENALSQSFRLRPTRPFSGFFLKYNCPNQREERTTFLPISKEISNYNCRCISVNSELELRSSFENSKNRLKLKKKRTAVSVLIKQMQLCPVILSTFSTAPLLD